MKFRSILASAAAMLLLAACTDANEPAPATPDGGDCEHYLTVRIVNPTDSRADDETFEYGSTAEQKISKLRFYFFKDGDAVAVGNNANFVEVTAGISQTSPTNPEGTQDGNIESTVSNIRVNLNLTSSTEELEINQMVVVANIGESVLGTESMDLATLKAKTSEFAMTSATEGSFVMSSSVYVDGSAVKCANDITRNNIGTVRTAGTSSGNSTTNTDPKEAVTVYLERVIAKARVSQSWTSSMTTVSGVSFNGKTYTAVALKTRGEGENATLKDVTVNGEQVYAIFTGWNVNAVTTTSYLFKNLPAGATSWEFGTETGGYWDWNSALNKRCYWAVNPAGVVINETLTYSDVTKTIGVGDTKSDVVYIQENAANNDSGEKSSKATYAVFAATLVTIDDENNATAVTLAKLGNELLTGESMINKIYESLDTKVWYETGTNQYSNDIRKFLDFMEVGEEGNKKVCVQLKAPAEGSLPTFYKGITDDSNIEDDLQTYSPDDINAALATACGNGLEIYNNGNTYYTYDIRHLGKMVGEKNYGYTGIVRNHVYDINLTEVYGPGMPVFTPTTITLKPVSYSYYLLATINVLSWRVVPNNAVLDWKN